MKLFSTVRVVFKNVKSEKKKKKNAENCRHHILRLFDTLQNFVFKIGETNRDYL